MSSDAGAGAASPDAIMHRVRTELQAQQIDDLVKKLTDKSFAKCVHKPGTSLTSSEQHCIAKAMDRYLDVMNIIFRTLTTKAQKG